MRIAAALAVLLIISTGAAAAGPASFLTPAQWSGQSSIPHAQWAIIVLGPSDAVSGTLSLASGTRAEEFTVVKPHASNPVLHVADGYSLGSSNETLSSPIQASAAMEGGAWKSLYVVADSIALAIAGGGDLTTQSRGDLANARVPEGAFPVGTVRQASHHLSSDAVTLTALPSRFGGQAWSLQAAGIHEIEIHNGTLACASSACPRQQGSSRVGPDGPVGADMQRYLNLQPTGGNASFSGTALTMATGAEALDVDVVGDVRIPGFGLGQTCNDKGCIKASGETLQATGEISLHGLRSDRGRPGGIQGEVNVKAGTARLDETPFDASLLSPFGAVAAVAVVGVGIALLALKVVAPFFTRIARPAALDHPNRRRIMDAITNSPGASFNGLRRMTGLASGTLRHHLSVLTSNRLVATKPFGTSVRHYPMDVASSAHHGLALLQDPASRRICDAIAGSPGLAQADILRRFNGEIPRSSVQFKLNRLVEAEILAIGVDGQRLQYGLGKRFPANPVAMALQSAG